MERGPAAHLLPEAFAPIVRSSNVRGGFPGLDNFDADPLLMPDLSLQPDSPCIDAGANAAVPARLRIDFAGALRFVDDPATPDRGRGQRLIVDMGAFEFQARCLVAPVTGSTSPAGPD